MRIVRVLDVKKVAYDLSCPFSKGGAPEADNDSNNPHESFYKHVFSAKVFD